MCNHVLLVVALTATALPAAARAQKPALDALRDSFGADAQISIHDGRVTFLHASKQSARFSRRTAAPVETLAVDFFREHGPAFGVRDAEAELRLAGQRPDALGGTRATLVQRVLDVDVFGAALHLHWDAGGNLRAVNGTFFADFWVDPTPALTASDGVAIATRHAEASGANVATLELRDVRLLGLRANAARRAPGRDHLVYAVDLVDGAGWGERLFVDAHTGKLIERHPIVHDAMTRRAYVGDASNLVWEEGQSMSGLDAEVQAALDGTAAVYDFFANASAGSYLSYDGGDSVMNVLYDPADSADVCPNAWWDGAFINLCVGVVDDDVVAHEWAHGVTDYNHNLIYAWQPGALNEAYSDIFGEVIDQLNGIGVDAPDAARSAGACSAYDGVTQTAMTVTAPADLEGEYTAGDAQFGPSLGSIAPVSGTLVVADPQDACDSLANPDEIAGAIALIERGTCDFSTKVYNAELAGAIAAVVYNNQDDEVFGMSAGASAASVTIPSVLVGLTIGSALSAEPPASATVTLAQTASGTDDSYRWLMGEGDSGPIRDMWEPHCLGQPDRSLDPFYFCGEQDNGGVHINSGVPNHAFALLVDGGTFNGESVSAIGVNKAVQIYWRAMTAYQGPYSDFPDHADALEASCADLIGVDVPNVATGGQSGETISAGDCDQVAAAMRAVEMREPVMRQCSFKPLLAPTRPPLCGSAIDVFSDDFETDTGWVAGREATAAGFTDRDWVRVSSLPGDRAGTAYFAADPIGYPCDDESGVLTLRASVQLDPGLDNLMLVFDHYVSTEEGYDGGNVRVRTNGTGWQTLAGSDFVHNGYNGTLLSADNTNPMAGEEAFSGTDDGAVSGSWGQSQVTLDSYAGGGDSLEIEFRFGTDVCVGNDGWYIDDVRLIACDNCPDHTNPGQEDADGDGAGDACDACPDDPNKTAPEVCGCGVAEGDTTTDTDDDGTVDCYDSCRLDPNKVDPGHCGCGVADSDTDTDGTLDCDDSCPTDADKTEPGLCGCGASDADDDGDDVPLCEDGCPADAAKVDPGQCGCGAPDDDADADGTADCNDACDADPDKTVAGVCGCGVSDIDADADGTPDCNDSCPTDANKTEPGLCGCQKLDGDRDSDGTPDCNDRCPVDPAKTEPGACGCGTPEAECTSTGGGTEGGCAATGAPPLLGLPFLLWALRRRRRQ